MRITRLHGESLGSIWARRAVSITAISAAFGLAGALSPLLLLLAAGRDLMSARSLPRSRALAFFLLYLSCEVLGIAASFTLWLVLGGGYGNERRYRRANAALQRHFTNALFFGALRIFRMKVVVEGDAPTSPCLIFARHASTADTVIAAALIANPRRMMLRYVLKRELLWDPCIDIVGRRLRNAFAQRGSSRRQAEIEAIGNLGRDLEATEGVLIYPEGTRFSQKKRDESLKKLSVEAPVLYALARDFRNVLPPRVGGVGALLDAAPLVDVVFLEHHGFEGARSFADFWAGGLVGGTLHVRLRRVAARSVPEDRAAWLYEEWARTDAWIQSIIA